MKSANILVSIFSNWTNLALTIVLAFIVSPIIVNQLGNEAYGIWVLIVSFTGYFTVLDFGVNSAIVRYVSKYKAQNELSKASQIYSTSFAFFSGIGVIVIGLTFLATLFFQDIFDIKSIPQAYLKNVIIIIGIDLAINLSFSVLEGTLKGLQRFLILNVVAIGVALIKNALLVYLLLNDYSLLSMALLQLSMTILKYSMQYIILKKNYQFLSLKISNVNRPTFRKIYSYSVYTFLIAIATKILFYTDSIVIGSLISVSQVTYYAIPMMIMENLEKLIWTVIFVFIPIISAQDATDGKNKNKALYITGTKYSLMLCAPVILVLFIAGDDFIGLWMGDDYASPSGDVLKILLVGYLFALSQLIAQGILKGISRHKILAYILCAEAIANLVLSVILAPSMGIVGVALGTTTPLIVASVIFIPYFTCKVLGLNFFNYLMKAVAHPILVLAGALAFLIPLDIQVTTFGELVILSILTASAFGIYGFFFQLETEHRETIVNHIRKKLLS